MRRDEMRAINRRSLTKEQNVMVGNAEINSLINQSAKEFVRDLGGEEYTSDITTNSDGIATLPSGVVRLDRVVYDGTQLGKMYLADITADLDDVVTTKRYYPYGRTKIGTHVALNAGTLTVFYEGYDSLPSITSKLEADEGELPTPDDWDQGMIDWIAWRLLMRWEGQDAFLRARAHKADYEDFFARAKANADRSGDVDTTTSTRGY